MPFFSERSKANLATCDPRLQAVMNAAIPRIDFAVICGHRNQADQDAAVAQGKSQTPWPTSKHNADPALACDCLPYPGDWNDIGAFATLASVVKSYAANLGIEIVWGGDWPHFKDYPHFELTDEWPKGQIGAP